MWELKWVTGLTEMEEHTSGLLTNGGVGTQMGDWTYGDGGAHEWVTD
ncbi:hypothetical protein QUF95_15220 [Paenibacillus silvae]|nr:hypothetical protein [Paenibacillus silvae]